MSLREVRGEPYGAVLPHCRTAIHLVSSLDVSGLGVESVEACFGLLRFGEPIATLVWFWGACSSVVLESASSV